MLPATTSKCPADFRDIEHLSEYVSERDVMQNFGAKRAHRYLTADKDEANLVDKIIAA
jgi:hypothetical protein